MLSSSSRWFYANHLLVWLLYATLCLYWALDELVINDTRLSLMLMDCAVLALFSAVLRFFYVKNWLGHGLILTLSAPIAIAIGTVFTWQSNLFLQAQSIHLSPNGLAFDLNFRDTTLVQTLFSYAAPLALWFSGYLVSQKVIQQQQLQVENLQLSIALSEAQLNTLKGQINPHFAFNALNNIRSLILLDPSQAREMITHLSEMLRYSLNANENDKVRLEHELEIVEDFVALAKIQFADRLQVQYQIEDGHHSFMVPPMMLQMLVENAIKHGISHINEGGTLGIYIDSCDEYLNIKVTNPIAQQVKKVPSTKVGLNNIKQRLALIYQQQAELNYRKTSDEFIANLKVPKESAA